ncbi:MAG: NAD(P)H-hydrate epimerase [Glaciecola sp.]|jgi:NAD(P)H-hydrate epimerase
MMSDFLDKLPKSLYRAAQVRQLDSLAIKEFSGLGLMQLAANAVFQALLERWPQTQFVQIFVGSGNNAGDGFLCAALAKEQTIPCEIVIVGDLSKLGPDAMLAYQKAKSSDVKMIEFDTFLERQAALPEHAVAVDALLGTGLDRLVTGKFAAAIEVLNSISAPVVAIDIPSGLSADTGMPLDAAVAANLTVTFIGLKQGMLTGRGRDYCGEILFHDLDIPEQVYSSKQAPVPCARRIDINFVKNYLRPRSASSHKGSNGHVVVIGGDTGFGGAAILCAEAALRGGAGLVSVISRSVHRPAALARCPELMWHGTEDFADSSTDGSAAISLVTNKISELLSRATVIVIGPGLGRGRWASRLFNQALSRSRAARTPLVIDADALHLLSDRMQLSGVIQGNWVLTPHPGEAGAMLNRSVAQIQDDRFESIKKLAETYGGSCLLKGSGSLIAHGAEPTAIELCSEGNPGMGSGGMGDLLAGLVAALVAQGIAVDKSLSCAVCIHGEAADLAAQSNGERGLVASDLLPWLRRLVNPSKASH